MLMFLLVCFVVLFVLGMLGPGVIFRLGVFLGFLWFLLFFGLMFLGGPGTPASAYLTALAWGIGGGLAIVAFSFGLAWVFGGSRLRARL